MKFIKFRAWDKSNKIIHNDFQFIKSGDSGNDWIVFFSDKEKKLSDKNGIHFNNPYFRDQLVIMQFTGIINNENKEVYEGDIVFFKKIGVVEYLNDRFYVNAGDRYEEINKNWNILGNIYENRDLL